VPKENLVLFFAEKKHMIFHPGKEATDAFADCLEKLPYTKSTLHLPCDQPMPVALACVFGYYGVIAASHQSGQRRYCGVPGEKADL